MSVMPNGKITSVIKLGHGSVQSTSLIKMLEVIMLSRFLRFTRCKNIEFDQLEMDFDLQFYRLERALVSM